MSDDTRESADELRALIEFGRRVDEQIEKSVAERRSLREILQGVLPLLAREAGASGAVVRTYDESLELVDFGWPEGQLAPPEGADGSRLLTHALDVAGEWFGTASLLFDAPPAKPAFAQAVLEAACEELDNVLHEVRAAREKHRVLMAVGEALRRPVLADGLRQAVAALAEVIRFHRLLLVYDPCDGLEAETQAQYYEGSRLVLDTLDGVAGPGLERHPAAEIPRHAQELLAGSPRPLLEKLGFGGAHEDCVIRGTSMSAVVGRIRITAQAAGFSTHDRELIAGFVAFVRQRLVDFNKEWRTLSSHFRSEDIAALLREEDYWRRLAPRVDTVAILYADISGFTSVSERVLKRPDLIARLIETWGKEAVSLVWSHGGVFDKMVGDCVIAFWGPPFYAQESAGRVGDAIRCARAIRRMTREIPARAGFESLRAEGLDVSTGVHFASICLGSFAPNGGFTGFSSGMNNAARLQGVAGRGEILVMEEAIAALGARADESGFGFGPPREAVAKNVSQPLRFRALLDEGTG